jgi:hypothetical protein
LRVNFLDVLRVRQRALNQLLLQIGRAGERRDVELAGRQCALAFGDGCLQCREIELAEFLQTRQPFKLQVGEDVESALAKGGAMFDRGAVHGDLQSDPAQASKGFRRPGLRRDGRSTRRSNFAALQHESLYTFAAGCTAFSSR